MLLGPIAGADTEEWRRMVAVNVFGVLFLGQSKGIWDCERRRMAMLYGGERPLPSTEVERRIASGCGRRSTRLLLAYGMRVRVCLPRRDPG